MDVVTNEEEDERDTDAEEKNYNVPITWEDKQRIYYPWRFTIIIKLQGKRLLHQILKRKLTDL